METTDKVLSERRMKAVRALAERCAPARTSRDVWKAVLDALEGNAADFPYVLCYTDQTTSTDGASSSSEVDTNSEQTNSDFLLAPDVTHLKLVGSIGIEPGHPIASPKWWSFLPLSPSKVINPLPKHVSAATPLGHKILVHSYSNAEDERILYAMQSWCHCVHLMIAHPWV
ncbi:uncharacterized protein BT62DRAFT_926676 [Guyanagaster necrorhizus]|uniref:Uncharacterized protein n=1 Tax=Guyanagaster necrorhizus TaxID=856835 RepID=A0A9P7W0G5_9AGAR|nr:uncharacterized protein BT62DRAFT_926676 [Guyanagaster necrorhizus MCA 3950]KAG7451021.1 hypothetical protein BT62DRAFT_926676 [Guyanagaster necrorhizus MCA 3950]